MYESSSRFEAIPSDILSGIFSIALPGLAEFRKRHLAISNLRLVCQQWNTLITCTPNFWASFIILIPSSSIPLPTVRIWLERSNNASIDVSIQDTLPVIWTRDEIRSRDELLATFQPHLWRCKSLSLEASLGFNPGLRKLQLADAHRLESFTINMRGNTDEQLHKAILMDISRLPSLRHLSWTDTAMPFMQWLLYQSEPSFLGRLSSIVIACPITTRELLTLIKSSTSAERIVSSWRARGGEPGSPIVSPSDPVVLPNLRRLEITLSAHAYRSLIYNTSLVNLAILKISGPSMSDLAKTVGAWAPSLKCLRTTVWTPRDVFDEMMAFLHHPDILRISILEIESRESDRWSEYGGWNELDDEQRLRPAAEEFNTIHSGVRKMIYDKQLGVFGRFFVGWIDPRLFGAERTPPFPFGDDFVASLLV
ncbi:hypothetical protein NP233_g8082 [Leucocoprinus birnbaumii]|uniref:F-box domain-containing protein n=1 Tax=Leucocoprinus birnbaumii TaxID=56174 RepID=A0AAD5YU59_9AGAR|nr:hypothetical protein NP233_g8082 [Leucocoprinus birnbaumii]